MKITGKLLSYDGVFAVIETNEAEPLEPKPLWGVKPVIHEPTQERYEDRVIYPAFPFWVITFDTKRGKISMQVKADTEAEAITAWNELVDKVQGER